MSYLRKIEYEIVTEESFPVIRNCAGCGKKTHFINTGNFRVNANGNKLDVWLIYQCEHCKHSLNLTIYERQNPALINKEEYACFLHNDENLAAAYGKNAEFFKRNKAEIDFQGTNYHIIKKSNISLDDNTSEALIEISNPYGLRLRPEKLISEILGISRSQVTRLLNQGNIDIKESSSQFLSIYISNYR